VGKHIPTDSNRPPTDLPLLPNGRYLGGGSVGAPFTFGCVMSRDDEAKQLYDWAQTGTVVEIVSSEFAPQSQLARTAFSDLVNSKA
jgi:hypothetical protein